MVVKAFCAALLLCVSTQVHAMCSDDLKDLRPRIDVLKSKDLPRYNVALRWWARAMDAEPGSEVECLGLLHRARIALSQTIPEISSCISPNAYLPNCQSGTPNAGELPMAPVTSIGGGGGGGGGVAAGAGPVPPVTQGGGNFNPPGSVDRGGVDQ
jgi:hypothetical protein